MNLIDDKDLVEKVKNGDKEAFDAIVFKYQHRIEKIIFKYVKDYDVSKDLAQDTFLNAYKSINNFRGDSKLYTWLYSIARNASINYLTSNNNKKKLFLDFDIDNDKFGDFFGLKVTDYNDNLTPESQMLCDEMVAAINKSIDSIHHSMKETFMLRYENEMSYHDIAKQLNIPLGTAKSRVSKARTKINNDLGIEYDRRSNKNSKKKQIRIS